MPHVGRKRRTRRKIHVVHGRVNWDAARTPVGLKRYRKVTLRNPESDSQFEFREGRWVRKELSEDETAELLQRRGKERWGTTEDSKKAGYILTDGSMLNMAFRGSERRNIHHEAVSDLYRDDQNNPDVPRDLSEPSEFAFTKNTGAIRMHASPYGHSIDVEINTARKPTSAQWETIQREFKQIRDRGGPHNLSYDVYDPRGKRVKAEFVDNATVSDLANLRREVQNLE